MSVSLYLSYYLILSLSIYIYIYIYISFSPSLSLARSLYVCLSLPFLLFNTLSIFLSLSLIWTFSLFLFVTACESGWQKQGDSCYLFVRDTMNWAAAKRNCEQKGAHLVVIDSEDEYNFLIGQLDSLNEHAWEGFWTAGRKNGSTWIWDAPGIGKFSSMIC